MQNPLAPMSSMPLIPAASLTTDQIQKYLDENKQLILAILENQNLGKLAECAQYQALLQKNLLYLAAIADAQPPGSGVRPQMMPQGAIPPGAISPGMIPPGAMPPGYMQQSPIFPPRAPLHLSPHQMQMQDQQQANHQTPGMSFAGQMGVRPGIVNGMPNMQAELCQGRNTDPPRSSHAGSAVDGQGSKQDGSGAASEATGTEHGSADADQASKTP